MRYDLYLPTDPRLGIDPASAVVGKTLEDGRIHVYFEGNRFGAANLKAFADRARSAAGRLHSRYPTIAQAIANPDQLLRIGTYDVVEWVIASLDPAQSEALQAWLPQEPAPLAIATESLKRVLYRNGMNAFPQGVGFWDGQAWIANWRDAAFLSRKDLDNERARHAGLADAKAFRFQVLDGREPVYLPE